MPRHKEDIEKINHGLRLNENISIQEKAWKFQNVGWVVLFIFLALSAAGLFGDGMLSRAKDGSGSTFISYEKFYRREAPMNIEFEISESEQTVISFPVDYLNKVRIVSILPSADHNETVNEMVHYKFNGSGKMEVRFHIIPERTGILKGGIQVNGKTFPLSQLIYP